MADVALRSYFLTPASDPKLTNPDEILEAIRGLKFSNGPDSNGIPNRALKHLPSERLPSLPSSFRHISFLGTIGKLFEKILLARMLHVVSERGLMRDQQFGFRPRHSTPLQLARLVERITRNFGEKRLTGAVFLDVAKAFDTV